MAETIKVEGGKITLESDLLDVLNNLRNDVTAGFSSVTTSLGAKADKSDVEGMRAQLRAYRDETDSRLRPLERALRERSVADRAVADERKRRWTWREKALAVAASIAMILATLFSVTVANVLH